VRCARLPIGQDSRLGAKQRGETMAALNNPFDLLPANLFNLLSSQAGGLQRHYMAILIRIYGLAEFNRFGLMREVVVAEIVDYMPSLSFCPTMPLPCWRPCGPSRNKSRASRPASCTPPPNFSPRAGTISHRSWPSPRPTRTRGAILLIRDINGIIQIGSWLL
jgi:hypothetical protein